MSISMSYDDPAFQLQSQFPIASKSGGTLLSCLAPKLPARSPLSGAWPPCTSDAMISTLSKSLVGADLTVTLKLTH
jgi:hypothetical protein